MTSILDIEIPASQQGDAALLEHIASMQSQGSFVDPRSPTVGIKRTPIKEVFELNEKLDSVNFKLFGEGTLEEEETQEGNNLRIHNVLPAEEYYSKFASMKEQGIPNKQVAGLQLSTIKTGSPKHKAIRAHQNKGLHSPSGLYCLSPASASKYGHFFSATSKYNKENVTNTKIQKGSSLVSLAAPQIEEEGLHIDIESPNGLNVSLNGEGNVYGTFFSPCRTKRKLRRVNVDGGDDENAAPAFA